MTDEKNKTKKSENTKHNAQPPPSILLVSDASNGLPGIYLLTQTEK